MYNALFKIYFHLSEMFFVLEVVQFFCQNQFLQVTMIKRVDGLMATMDRWQLCYVYLSYWGFCVGC